MISVLLLMFAVSCTHFDRVDSSEEVVRLANSVDQHKLAYLVDKSFRVVEPDSEKLTSLIGAYRERVDVLANAATTSDSRNARIFALHALTKSRASSVGVAFSKCLMSIANGKDEDTIIAALWYAQELNGPATVSIQTIQILLGCPSFGVRFGTLLGVRNCVILPERFDSQEIARSLFEIVLQSVTVANIEWSERENLVRIGIEILEDLATPRFRRGPRIVAAIPLLQAPMTFSNDFGVKSAGRHCESWKQWWDRFNPYLVWIPIQFKMEQTAAEQSLAYYFNPFITGGGFFILDEQAFNAGVPTNEYRKENAWPQNAGPYDPAWYFRQGRR